MCITATVNINVHRNSPGVGIERADRHGTYRAECVMCMQHMPESATAANRIVLCMLRHCIRIGPTDVLDY